MKDLGWGLKTKLVKKLYWLVVWNMFYFSIYWECHHPNWRTHSIIFQRGRWLNHQPGVAGDSRDIFLGQILSITFPCPLDHWMPSCRPCNAAVLRIFSGQGLHLWCEAAMDDPQISGQILRMGIHRFRKSRQSDKNHGKNMKNEKKNLGILRYFSNMHLKVTWNITQDIQDSLRLFWLYWPSCIDVWGLPGRKS